MGVIDINVDDRDTIIHSMTGEAPVSATNYKELLNRIKTENSTSKVVHIGLGIFLIDLPIIISTGSDVETIIQIPFMHEIRKLEIKHTDNLDVNSEDSLDYSMCTRTFNNLWYLLYKFDNVVHANIHDELSGMFKPNGQYKFVTNTTNTDKLIVSVYFQVFQ